MMVTYNFYYFLLITTVYFVGFLSDAASIVDGHNKNKSKFGKWITLAPTRGTTPASQTPELSCETMYSKPNKSIDIKQEMQDLMGQYNNWGKLLAPAPSAIGILGQLILMANQRMDFSIQSDNSQKTFKYIQYPESFRTTLLQISQSGYRAFLKAHNNMHAIRLQSSTVPGDIKNAVKYLISGNVKIIKLRLPATTARIKEAAKKSQDLSNDVVNEFNITLSLIDETKLAAMSKRRGAEIRLKDTILDIKLEQEAKKLSEKEHQILKEKEVKMNTMFKKLEHRKGHLYHQTIYGNIDFTINLAMGDWEAEIGKEIGQKQYSKDKNFLRDKSQTWIYTYFNKFIKSNPCFQKNSEPLLEFLITSGEYRTRYERWQNSNSEHIFSGSKFISSYESILENLQTCPDVDTIIAKISGLIKKLKNSNTFQSKGNSTTERPCSKEIDEIIILVNKVRTAANDVTEESGKKEEIVKNSAWDLMIESKQHQLNQLKSMAETVEDIIKLNNELMEIRRQKTKRILDRIASLDVTKVHISEVIRTLKEGLTELGNLKEHWAKLIRFFVNIQNFIEITSRYSTGLVEIVQTLSSNPKENLKHKTLFSKILSNTEKSNEAVLLVHGIADLYVQVSDSFIMEQVTRLNTMNSMMIDGATDEQLKQEKEILSKNATQTSEGIEEFFDKQAVKLNETLKTRHNEFFAEYEQLFKCLADKGLIDRAINFTGNDYWFQIKSRMSGKVLDVSLVNNSVVQMWESHGKDNQLWYLDKDNIIRSYENDGCLTTHGHYLSIVTVEPCKNTRNQKWMIKDDIIVNIENPKRCLQSNHESFLVQFQLQNSSVNMDVHNFDQDNGERIVEFICRRGANQLWDVIKY